PTARSPDRLRQQQLEALGWRFHRIWSTDWFLRRSDEIERVMQAYQQAVRQADDDDEGFRPEVGTLARPRNAAPRESVSPTALSETPVSRTRGKKPSFP